MTYDVCDWFPLSYAQRNKTHTRSVFDFLEQKMFLPRTNCSVDALYLNWRRTVLQKNAHALAVPVPAKQKFVLFA